MSYSWRGIDDWNVGVMDDPILKREMNKIIEKLYDDPEGMNAAGKEAFRKAVIRKLKKDEGKSSETRKSHVKGLIDQMQNRKGKWYDNVMNKGGDQLIGDIFKGEDVISKIEGKLGKEMRKKQLSEADPNVRSIIVKQTRAKEWQSFEGLGVVKKKLREALTLQKKGALEKLGETKKFQKLSRKEQNAKKKELRIKLEANAKKHLDNFNRMYRNVKVELGKTKKKIERKFPKRTKIIGYYQKKLRDYTSIREGKFLVASTKGLKDLREKSILSAGKGKVQWVPGITQAGKKSTGTEIKKFLDQSGEEALKTGSITQLTKDVTFVKKNFPKGTISNKYINQLTTKVGSQFEKQKGIKKFTGPAGKKRQRQLVTMPFVEEFKAKGVSAKTRKGVILAGSPHQALLSKAVQKISKSRKPVKFGVLSNSLRNQKEVEEIKKGIEEDRKRRTAALRLDSKALVGKLEQNLWRMELLKDRSFEKKKDRKEYDVLQRKNEKIKSNILRNKKNVDIILKDLVSPGGFSNVKVAQNRYTKQVLNKNLASNIKEMPLLKAAKISVSEDDKILPVNTGDPKVIDAVAKNLQRKKNQLVKEGVSKAQINDIIKKSKELDRALDQTNTRTTQILGILPVLEKGISDDIRKDRERQKKTRSKKLKGVYQDIISMRTEQVSEIKDEIREAYKPKTWKAEPKTGIEFVRKVSTDMDKDLKNLTTHKIIEKRRLLESK